jgi:hypothetical protein
MLPLLPPIFALLAPSAAAQGPQAIKFSIDWKSKTVSHLDTLHNQPITEGDILVPAVPPSLGNMPRPNILTSGQLLSLAQYPSCVGHVGGTPCEIEIDALSDGLDEQFTTGPNGIVGGGSGIPGADHKQVWFSVDEFARGSVVQTPLHPQVSTEGFPPTPAAFEASADVFCAINLPAGPLPPGAVPSNNAGLLDGNGLPSTNGFAYPGLGLIEPNQPTPPANPGDNVDALDIGPPPTPGSYVYLSLDSPFVDPLTNIANTGSAHSNGFVGGDVLYTVFPGGPLTLYASAQSLGLDRVPPALGGGPDSDDLDALILWDNGNHTFQPSEQAYDWVGGNHDMLIFSVRRGSAVIGKPDSIFGIPICEGDLLTSPLPPALGGLSPFPGIFIAAENLGLFTARGVVGAFSDELDAAEYVKKPRFDCNENGVEDSIDIANGASSDTNKNGIPDECEDKVVEFCWCPPSLAPCGNSSTTSGCTNSSSSGSLLAWTGGTVNTPADDLVLTATHLPTNVSGILYMGPVPRPVVMFYDGLRCVGTPNYRFPLLNSGTAGAMTFGPGLIAHSMTAFPLTGHIDAGESWYFQCWYRDGPGPCGTGSNLSNVVRVDFQP